MFHPRVVGPGATVAVRQTPHPAVRDLLLALREPLTSTSANAPGAPSALTAADAAAVLQRAGATDALVLDGGALAASKPSTLVDCSVEPPQLIREGVITLGDLAKIVPVNG
jgi:tRNA A37 threonylcarbamoyladenosine synthetase subunit TsaC/SUA5/YrdC